MGTLFDKRLAAAKWKASLPGERLPHLQTQAQLADHLGIAESELSSWNREAHFNRLVDKQALLLTRQFNPVLLAKIRALAGASSDLKLMFEFYTKLFPVIERAYQTVDASGTGYMDEVTGVIDVSGPDEEKVYALLQSYPIEVQAMFSGLLKDLKKLPAAETITGTEYEVTLDMSEVDYAAAIQGVPQLIKGLKGYDKSQVAYNEIAAIGDNLDAALNNKALLPGLSVVGKPAGSKLSSVARKRLEAIARLKSGPVAGE